VYTGQAAGRQQRLLLKKGEANRKFALSAHSVASTQNELDFSEEEITGTGIDGEQIISRNKVNGDAGSKGRSGSLIDTIDRITDGRELTQIWQGFQKQEIKGIFTYSVEANIFFCIFCIDFFCSVFFCIEICYYNDTHFNFLYYLYPILFLFFFSSFLLP
jgi:hypothetical protein